MARLPQLLGRSFDEAFGKTEPTPEPTESPTPEWTTSKDDWKASLKIVSKQCHGYGLGCSIDAKVKLSYSQTAAVSQRTPGGGESANRVVGPALKCTLSLGAGDQGRCFTLIKMVPPGGQVPVRSLDAYFFQGRPIKKG